MPLSPLIAHAFDDTEAAAEFTRQSIPLVQTFQEHLHDFVPRRHFVHVLSVGCGAAARLEVIALRETFHLGMGIPVMYQGVDIDESAVQEANDRFGGDPFLHVTCEDASAFCLNVLQQGSLRYDLVLAGHPNCECGDDEPPDSQEYGPFEAESFFFKAAVGSPSPSEESHGLRLLEKYLSKSELARVENSSVQFREALLSMYPPSPALHGLTTIPHGLKGSNSNEQHRRMWKKNFEMAYACLTPKGRILVTALSDLNFSISKDLTERSGFSLLYAGLNRTPGPVIATNETTGEIRAQCERYVIVGEKR